MDATPNLRRLGNWFIILGPLLVFSAVPALLVGQERPVARLGTPVLAEQNGQNAQPPPGEAVKDNKQLPPPAGGPESLPAPRPVTALETPLVLPPTVEPGEEALPINLPTALRLANARSLDIEIAIQQLRIASAVEFGADVLWVPTLGMGTVYQAHTGPTQNTDGTATTANKASLYTGLAPFALFSMSDAIFEPLSLRQVSRAQAANVQTATNDTLTDVAVTYFDAQEARAELGGVREVIIRTAKAVEKTRELVPAYVPEVELHRVRAAYYDILQFEETARQRWRLASYEVARVLRLKPNVVVQPMEPPHLHVTLIPPERTPEEMIPVALANRPELTFTQAKAEAARLLLQQERFRPLVPNFVLRGGGNAPPYAMAYGAYGSGTSGGSVGDMMSRSDWDLEVVWELRNLGFGNHALIRGREASFQLARAQDYRFRDLVGKEVSDAWAEVRSAQRRVGEAELELRDADVSAIKNLEGLGQVKRIAQTAVFILVIRPLEVVVSLQALVQAYFDYYGSVADYNRAQFRLFRALGNPSQALYGRDGLGGPPLPPPPPEIMHPAGPPMPPRPT